MITPWYTDAEIDNLCEGLATNAAKCRYLRAMGLTVNKKPNGRPLVIREHAELVLSPVASVESAPREAQAPYNGPFGGRVPLRHERRVIRWTAAQKATIAADALRRNAEQHSAVVRYHAAKRKAARLKRTPAWADMDAILAIYVEARRITIESGVERHVDHEIPLQGRFVSGLHVHQNLQILTKTENLKKGCNYEIEP